MKYVPGSKTERRYDGQFTCKEILKWPNPKLDFTYQNGKWSFRNWKFQRKGFWDSGKMDSTKKNWPDDLDNMPIDIDNAIQEASKGDKSTCGELVNFIIDKLVKMGFNFDLGMKPIKQEDMEKKQLNTEDTNTAHKAKPGFTFTVDWSWSITVMDQDIGGNIHLQQFEFVLPFECLNFTVKGVLQYLWEKVLSKENLEELGKKLLEPATLGKLLFVMAIEKLGPKLIEDLACREPEGEGGDKLKEEANKRHEEDSNNKKKDGKKGDGDMKDTGEKGKGNNGTGDGTPNPATPPAGPYSDPPKPSTDAEPATGPSGGSPGTPGVPGLPGLPGQYHLIL